MTKGPAVITLPVDPFTISRDLGIEVWSDDEMSADVSGVLRKKAGFNDPVIFLNERDARDRRRFTCAHALGHYSRRTEMGREEEWEIVDARGFFDVSIGDVEEAYATQFAAELLMPRVALRELIDEPSAAALAAIFGVTGDIMRFRLDQIGWRR